METTKIKYIYPIDRKNIVKTLYKKSPAHSAKYKKGIYRYAVDFVCAEGTSVKAAADGKIIEVCSNKIGGQNESFDRFANYIEIDHQNGEYSEYEHDGLPICVRTCILWLVGMGKQ